MGTGGHLRGRIRRRRACLGWLPQGQGPDRGSNPRASTVGPAIRERVRVAEKQVAPARDMLESVRGHTSEQMTRIENLMLYIVALRMDVCQALSYGYGRADLRSMAYYQQRVNTLIGELRATNHDVAQLIRHL